MLKKQQQLDKKNKLCELTREETGMEEKPTKRQSMYIKTEQGQKQNWRLKHYQ
jgi:hypothetical protein